MNVATLGFLVGRILVDGLMLVPEQGKVELWADEK
jgi:hypothetical protein